MNQLISRIYNRSTWTWWRQTYSYAAEAAEFGAVRAETSIPQLLHADEAAKHLCYALQGQEEREDEA